MVSFSLKKLFIDGSQEERVGYKKYPVRLGLYPVPVPTVVWLTNLDVPPDEVSL